MKLMTNKIALLFSLVFFASSVTRSGDNKDSVVEPVKKKRLQGKRLKIDGVIATLLTLSF
jgi:hypothetical protein